MADPWSDVVAHPGGGFARAVSEDGAVRVELNGVFLWRRFVETDFLRALRMAVAPNGSVAVIGQGGEGAAWFVTQNSDAAIAVSFGENSVAIRHDGTRFVTYVQVAADRYEISGVPHAMPWSSQGIRDVLPNGSVRFGDDYLREMRLDGHSFWKRTQRDNFVVGQVADGIGVYSSTTGKFFHAASGLKIAEGIHFALQTNGDLAVVALTEHGALYELFAAPYPPNEPAALPATPVVKIGRPCWLGWFIFGSATVPGNCSIQVGDSYVTSNGVEIARYAAAEADGTLEGLNRAIAAAKLTARAPVLAYWSKKLQRGELPNSEFVGIEAYQDASESLADVETRVRWAASRCKSAWLICKGYNNPGQTVDLVPLVAMYSRIARDYPQIKGLLVFSAGSRRGGWSEHPEIHELWQQLAEGVSLPKGEFVEPFKVTVVEPYSKTIESGKEYRQFVKLGNGLEIEVHKSDADTMQFAVFKDGVEVDRSSGTSRRVKIVG